MNTTNRHSWKKEKKRKTVELPHDMFTLAFIWKTMPTNKVIVKKSRGKVSLVEQDTIENVS